MNLSAHTSGSNWSVATQLRTEKSRRWRLTERTSTHLSCGWDLLAHLSCEMECDTATGDHRNTSSRSAQTSASNAMVHGLGELSTAHKLENPQMCQVNATIPHLTTLGIPAVCSPSQLVSSYHTWVLLADLNILFMINVHWREVPSESIHGQLVIT